MINFTTNTYQMKREIVKFSKKICEGSKKPISKFVIDMIYSISKSKDILLSSIADALDETTKKANTINRLSDNLAKNLDESIDNNYCNLVMDSLGDNPVFLVDDSDIIKPLGNKFENLGMVRDGSSRSKSYEKGYHHTEIVGLTKDMKQPISIYSKIYSSMEKNFISWNEETNKGLDKVINLLEERKLKGIFIHDRGYDINELFKYYFRKKQYFIIRLTEKRKIYRNHKWYKITTLRDAFKGKIKMKLMFQGEEKECYVSVIKVQITAEKRWINLIFIYGLSDTPMMLASNIGIKSKEDVIKIARGYINRWRIEEYFKFKKQEYGFENFRIRSLTAIRNLNKKLTYTIGLIAILSEKIGKREFINKIIKESKSLKEKVYLWFYQIARGIYNILTYARSGIRGWEEIRKTKVYDGQLSLL